MDAWPRCGVPGLCDLQERPVAVMGFCGVRIAGMARSCKNQCGTHGDLDIKLVANGATQLMVTCIH